MHARTQITKRPHSVSHIISACREKSPPSPQPPPPPSEDSFTSISLKEPPSPSKRGGGLAGGVPRGSVTRDSFACFVPRLPPQVEEDRALHMLDVAKPQARGRDIVRIEDSRFRHVELKADRARYA